MNIALVTRRYPPLIGGAEKVLSYLAAGLAGEGHQVRVYTSRLDVEELAESETVELPRGSLEVVRLRTSRLRVVGTWLHMRHLAARLEREPPDVAYVSMLKHDAYAALGAARKRGFPVVLRPEGAGATGDLAWQSWGRFGRKIGLRCREADAFVAISKPIEQELRQAWSSGTLRAEEDGRRRGQDDRGRQPRIVSIPNGVPMEETPWQRRADWRQQPRAVYLGRLAAEKGVDLLVQSWPRVRQAIPEARLELVGEGPERPALERLVERLGLRGAVFLPGATTDPIGVLRGADLFVLPSREEGMSVALLEAMGLGIPLVASSITGNRKLVADFKHGRLFPTENVAQLAQAIVEQWNDYDRAIHMGRAARGLVEQKYSIRAVSRRHLELFETLLIEPRG